MKKLLRLKIHFFCLALLLTQTGCAVIKKTRVLPADQRLLPAKTATFSELLKGLEERSKQVETIKGSILIDLTTGGPRSGVLKDYRETKGALVVARPNRHMWIKVQIPVVLTTLATMVSDGNEYRVSIPIKNQYAVGDVNAPLSNDSTLNNLRPKIIMDGLFVDIRPYLSKPQQYKFLVEEAVEGVHSYYVLGVIDVSAQELESVERLWIDRSDLQVARKQMFGKGGKLETDVRYQNYKIDNDIAFPETVVISRPMEDYMVKMTFTSKSFNEAIPDEVFALPRPEGSQLVQLTK